jgi:hypothetical protein
MLPPLLKNTANLFTSIDSYHAVVPTKQEILNHLGINNISS